MLIIYILTFAILVFVGWFWALVCLVALLLMRKEIINDNPQHPLNSEYHPPEETD